MHWIEFAAYFFGGAFFSNALPHLINGVSGRSFQSPFAKPPGKGLSSPTVNVLWGFLNLVLAYLFIVGEGTFSIRNPWQVGVVGAGFLVMSLISARAFGRFHSSE